MDFYDKAQLFQKKKCAYCGVDLCGGAPVTKFTKTKDHLMPKSRGGRGWRNLVYACFSCNGQKKDRTLEEYRRYRQVLSLRDSLGDHAQSVLSAAAVEWLLEQEWFPHKLEPYLFACESAALEVEGPVVPELQKSNRTTTGLTGTETKELKHPLTVP